MPRPICILIYFAILAVFAVTGSAIFIGDRLSQSAQRSVGMAPPDLPAESIILCIPPDSVDASAGYISGWLARGTPGMGVVLLLHGVRSDRRQMLGRAIFLFQSGYSVMLIDLPAHGESSGDRITVGYHEANGVRSAVHYLAELFPDEAFAVIAVSLGAAAFMLSQASPAPHAVVLESMYPTIENAIDHRMQQRLGSFGRLLTPLFLWQLPIRWGISPDQLRPIDALPALHSPVLIMSGAEDRHTPVSETQRLFDAANPPKELSIVAGAAHVDLHAFDPKGYESRVSTFLHKYLCNGNCTVKQSDAERCTQACSNQLVVE
ncbi:Fermentation-respiration switch protein FrsA, has esterase activity, DUF1100 family [Nitrosomonas halophila]|uniref:Fermentation-respiration switch protein FrsA, has esterase activity, DUF1100 family n=2 Tax=Nitrosomonas halophila TaxID=44576 RepID=A0A1H3PSY5_9PROT|nr:Fermentation-respiration switch protein FrsA, has esterase activity, DUF1100 family [Nitrosomonas halophila]